MDADTAALLTETSVECAAEIGVDVGIAQRVFNWQFDNSETIKKFSFCLFGKTGFSNETGYFNKDKVLALFEKSDMKESISDAFDYCQKLNEKTPLEIMYRGILCFYEKSPVLVKF